MAEITKPKALVVDDNPFNRKVLKIGLIEEGFAVEEGQNGKEALTWTARTEFDLIFMDLLMPGLTGFETIEQIRQMGILTPIIIISSMTSREDRARCLEVGGNDFLAKPITAETIREIVRKFREGRLLHAKHPTGIEAKASVIHFSDYSALVVEADEFASAHISGLLKALEFNFDRVSGGEEAWTRLSADLRRADVVITNLFTPDIDGLGLVARIKRNYPEVLAIIYAQDYDPDTISLAAELGADGFIDQTRLAVELKQTIESAIFKSAKKGSRAQTATTAHQVRKAQEQLIRFGCLTPCETIDIGYAPLTDAGGDMACCRRFNNAGRCGVFLGDVSGHDVMASYISAMSLGILSSTWDQHQHPDDLIHAMNAELFRSGNENYHLCATALLWDRIRGEISVASAGNPGVFAIQEDGSTLNYPGGGLCLGLLPENRLFTHHHITINDQTYLMIHSDGIETEDILELLSTGRVSTNRDSIRGFCDEIFRHLLDQQKPQDDMILIILKQIQDFKDLGWHKAIASNYHAVDEACEWAGSLLKPAEQWLRNDLDLILLSIREALINAVKHGNRFMAEKWIDMSIFQDSESLTIEISDQGTGFSIPSDLKKINDLNMLQMGGRGLSIMFTVADTLFVEGGTVSMTFQKKTAPSFSIGF